MYLQFIGVEYDDVIFTNYKSESLKLGLNMPWHDDIDREIKAPAIPKYKQIFQRHEIEYILEKLKTC